MPFSSVVPTSLADVLDARLRAAGNWLRFDDFMDLALYTPVHGYYCKDRLPFGPQGDFVTAPGLSPLFGACVARQVAEVFEALGVQQLVEFGAGDGQLAAQILATLESQGFAPHYKIVEVSAPLRAAQHARLLGGAARGMRIDWLERLPAAGFRGVILANELLDAMPVRLFVYVGETQGQGRWLERGVRGTLAGPAASRASELDFADRPVDPIQSRQLDALRAHCQSIWPEPWPEGMVVEWHAQAQAWLRTLAERIDAGMILLIDYGFPAHEYYLPARHQGTLLAHRAHRATPEVLACPGEQDLSVHLDFTALARAGLEEGLALAGYCTQARFLLNCGLLDLLHTAADPVDPANPADAALGHCRANRATGAPSLGGLQQGAGSLAQAQRLAGVQRLISDAEMGELVKVMAFTRGIDRTPLGFVRGDRRGRLGLEGVPL